MTHVTPKFSICIPAYKRARYLAPLLDSIYAQDSEEFEIVICEDGSVERDQIGLIAREYAKKYPGTLRYFENPENLGYDANIRNLISKAQGQYCFFMGNDDLMAVGALTEVSDIIGKNPGVGFVLKSYAWFDVKPELLNQEVRYFSERRVFPPSVSAVELCFRRSGVISGFIVNREIAAGVATERFDGTLYYQMHLVSQAVYKAGAATTPMVLVYCRNSEPPDFGSSKTEKGVFTPGGYTVAARLTMIGGICKILDYAESQGMVGIKQAVMQDYANYFYPYIKDQLNIPLKDYLRLYNGYKALGFGQYRMFHVYFVLCRILGERKFDALTAIIRKKAGRSPQIGKVFKAKS